MSSIFSKNEGIQYKPLEAIKIAVIRQLEYMGTASVLQEVTIAPSRIVENDVT